MENKKTNALDFQKITDWIPVSLIIAGLGLTWLEIDNHAIVMNFGFISYGVFGLIDSIKKDYYKHLSLKLLKLLGQLTIFIFSIQNLISPSSLMFLLLLILFDRIVLTPNRIE